MEPGKRFLTICPTPISLRNTLLYRTLLHELGHQVDFCTRNERGWMERTASQREDFAHRYASEAMANLKQAGMDVPFPRLMDQAMMLAEGLLPKDFLLPQAPPERDTEA